MFKSRTPLRSAGLLAAAFAMAVVAGPAWAPPNFEAIEVACENPCIDSFEIEDGEVGTADLADGAVTVSKLAFDPVPLQRVVYVSGNGTTIDNGMALLDAMDEIGTSGPCAVAPSAALPCLVKIGPGVFDLGAESLAMVDYTDIEGSGQGVTLISNEQAGNSSQTILGANAELRNLSVENRSTVPLSNRGIVGADNLRISQATVLVPGDASVGIAFASSQYGTIADVLIVTATGGISAGGASVVTLDNVTATEGKAGLSVSNSAAAEVRNSTLHGEFVGIQSTFGNPTVNVYSSRLAGGNQAVRARDASVTIHGSVIDGDVTLDAGSVDLATSQVTGTAVGATCVYVYDGAFAPHACTAP